MSGKPFMISRGALETAVRRRLAWAVLWGALVLTPSVAPAQTLLWESRGQPEFGGAVVDIADTRDTVVAAGFVNASPSRSQWYVRAVEGRTGATVWEDRLGPMLFGQARDASIRGNRVFVTGWLRTPANGFVFAVRAYRLDTGAVSWTREVGLGSQCAAESGTFARCVAKALDVHDGRVFAVGHLTRTANRSDFAVLAFDAATGAPLWESVTDSGTGANDYAWAVKATGDSVFVYGETGDFSGVLLRAHDARTGAIRWQQRRARRRQLTRCARRSPRTAATSSSAGRTRRTGSWSGPTTRHREPCFGPTRGRAPARSSALALGEEGGEPRLFATGIIGCNADFVECELAVRAYDPRTAGCGRGRKTPVAATGSWARS